MPRGFVLLGVDPETLLLPCPGSDGSKPSDFLVIYQNPSSKGARPQTAGAALVLQEGSGEAGKYRATEVRNSGLQ